MNLVYILFSPLPIMVIGCDILNAVISICYNLEAIMIFIYLFIYFRGNITFHLLDPVHTSKKLMGVGVIG
jgi:hypothetical protein